MQIGSLYRGILTCFTWLLKFGSLAKVIWMGYRLWEWSLLLNPNADEHRNSGGEVDNHIRQSNAFLEKKTDGRSRTIMLIHSKVGKKVEKRRELRRGRSEMSESAMSGSRNYRGYSFKKSESSGPRLLVSDPGFTVQENVHIV